jgi:hypothetical protein
VYFLYFVQSLNGSSPPYEVTFVCGGTSESFPSSRSEVPLRHTGAWRGIEWPTLQLDYPYLVSMAIFMVAIIVVSTYHRILSRRRRAVHPVERV